VQLDAVQLCPSTHTSPDPTWPHEVPPAVTQTPAPHFPQPAHWPPHGVARIVVVVVPGSVVVVVVVADGHANVPQVNTQLISPTSHWAIFSASPILQTPSRFTSQTSG